MNTLVVTVDIDWASEPAVEEILDFLQQQNIRSTIFVTHHSFCIKDNLDRLDVGLHPFFDPNSSHGSTIADVVKCVMDIPHNLPAFRCHRYAICNSSRQAMVEAGMK